MTKKFTWQKLMRRKNRAAKSQAQKKAELAG